MICLASHQKLKNYSNAYFEKLSQLGDCKKELEASRRVLSETAQTVKFIEIKMANFQTSSLHFQNPSMNEPCIYADAVKRTLDGRDYDIKAEGTIVLHNSPETSTPVKTRLFVINCKLFLRKK